MRGLLTTTLAVAALLSLGSIARADTAPQHEGDFVIHDFRGHGAHTLAAVWQGYLAGLLKESER